MSASPQLEDGFVRIANELLEAILRFDLSHREQSVVLAIVRKTYGYGKKEDDISAAQIGALCGIARPHVTAALNQLALRNVITKRAGRFGSIIGIQKNHRKWVGQEQMQNAIDSTDSVQGSTESVHVPNQYMGGTESVQVDSTDSVHTKDNLPKDNHQKKTSCAPQANRDIEPNAPAGRKDRATTSSQADIDNRFERFYEAYPKKKSRQAAVKAFAKLNPDEQLLADMLAGLERAMKSEQWRDLQFVPHPATWLNAAGWLDEIVLDYSAAELEIIRSYNDALGEQLGAVSESIFVASRAAAIRDFCTLSEKPGFAFKFFPWVRDTVDVPPRAGFDYLISRQGFSAVKGGQHSRKAT